MSYADWGVPCVGAVLNNGEMACWEVGGKVKPVVSLSSRWRFGDGDLVAVDGRFLFTQLDMRGGRTHKTPWAFPTFCIDTHRYMAPPASCSSDKSSFLVRFLRANSDQPLPFPGHISPSHQYSV